MDETLPRVVRNGDVSLALERRGHGPRALLFAHGWISSRRMWYDVVGRLDPSQYTSYLLDFRGCGESDRPMEGHDLDGYVGDLRAALASLDTSVTLIGHSMGGKLAQLVASDRPEHLERMILVAPGTARAARFPEKHRELTLAAYGSRARIESFQRAAMVRPLDAEVVERLVVDALVCQREHWIGWYDRGRSIDFSDRLQAISVPTLVIAGDKDPLAPASRLRRDVAGAIEGALFVVLKHAGHNLPVESPDEIAGAIARFG